MTIAFSLLSLSSLYSLLFFSLSFNLSLCLSFVFAPIKTRRERDQMQLWQVALSIVAWQMEITQRPEIWVSENWLCWVYFQWTTRFSFSSSLSVYINSYTHTYIHSSLSFPLQWPLKQGSWTDGNGKVAWNKWIGYIYLWKRCQMYNQLHHHITPTGSVSLNLVIESVYTLSSVFIFVPT